MSKHTRKAISEAFMELLQKKSLDKITVKEVIESAEINRNTFYYHYRDIYDLLEHIFREESIRFRSETRDDSTFYEECERMIRFFQNHKKEIIHIYHSRSRKVLNQLLESEVCHFLDRFIDKAAEGSGLSNEGKDYVSCFYSYAFIGAIMRWVEDQMPDYNDDLMKTISRSFEETVGTIIRIYIEDHPEECGSPAEAKQK